MIEINLLPEEEKVKTKKAPEKFQYVLYVLPLLAAIILLVHLYLASIQASRSLQLNALTSKWKTLEPQRTRLVDLKSESSASSQEERIAQEIAAKSISWSKTLNKLSLDLPSGIWFNELSVGRTELLIRATVVSLGKDEVDLINRFMTNLKNDSDFMKDFTNLDLGPVQKRTIGSYEVADFVLNAELKPR